MVFEMHGHNVKCFFYYCFLNRLFIVMMCVIAILWVPMVKAFQSGRLFNYMTAVEGYIGSPLGVLFLLSIFSTRITEAVRENILTLKAPITTAADGIHKYFFIVFQRK